MRTDPTGQVFSEPRCGSKATHALFCVVLGVFLGPPFFRTGAAAPPDDVAAFQQLAKTAAKTKGATLCRWGTVQYGKDNPKAFFAVYQSSAADDRHWVVFVAWDDQREAYRSDTDDLAATPCPGGTKPPAWETLQAVPLGPVALRPKEWAEIAVVDDELVQISERAEDHNFASRTDWETLVDSESFFSPPSERAAAILPIIDGVDGNSDNRKAGASAPRRAPKPETWVTFSRGEHGGPTDGDLDVRVRLVKDALEITLFATDDVAIPPTRAGLPTGRFIKADHFEIWFCARKATKDCDRRGARQLGIAKTADGKIERRWLHPQRNKEPLPAIAAAPSEAGGGLVVTLPLGMIRHDGRADLYLDGELTVAYSDTDDPAKGQEAVIATSRLRWGDGASFGRFVRHPLGGRYPSWQGGAGFTVHSDFTEDLPESP